MLKKKIIFYVVFLLTTSIFILLLTLFIRALTSKSEAFEYARQTSIFDATSPFSINKIVYFSTANADISINQNSSFTINNLSQMTDIAVFLTNNANGSYTNKNTLKKVSLTDIKFTMSPSSGTPNLYYKNINDFAKYEFSKDNLIENTIDFSVSSEDEIDYSKPILYNNTANPITLSYVNSNILSNYTLSDSISNISYNGNLLKTCGITLNSISCKIAFNINIENNLDELYSCPIIITIPLSTEKSTIYDGNLTLYDNVNYRFIKSTM